MRAGVQGARRGHATRTAEQARPQVTCPARVLRLLEPQHHLLAKQTSVKQSAGAKSRAGRAGSSKSGVDKGEEPWTLPLREIPACEWTWTHVCMRKTLCHEGPGQLQCSFLGRAWSHGAWRGSLEAWERELQGTASRYLRQCRGREQCAVKCSLWLKAQHEPQLCTCRRGCVRACAGLRCAGGHAAREGRWRQRSAQRWWSARCASRCACGCGRVGSVQGSVAERYRSRRESRRRRDGCRRARARSGFDGCTLARRARCPGPASKQVRHAYRFSCAPVRPAPNRKTRAQIAHATAHCRNARCVRC